MRAASRLFVMLSLIILYACETVPVDLDRPAVATGERPQSPDIQQHPNAAKKNELETERHDQSSAGNTDDSHENSTSLKDLGTATKAVAKIIIFAPLLPFCYLSRNKTDRKTCPLD